MKALAILSSLVAAAAGLYLLSTTAAAENSLLEVIMHGMGIYFLAKALYLGPSLIRQDDAARHLAKLVEWRDEPETDEDVPEVKGHSSFQLG